MSIEADAGRFRQPSHNTESATCVPDAVNFSETKSSKSRFVLMLSAIIVGVSGGALLNAQGAMTSSITWLFVVLTFMGGLFSTWSPCGYSSLSLLRPAGKYSLKSVTRWTPTFITHAIGYAFGALILGGGLGLVGAFLFEQLAFSHMVIGLAMLAIGYGAHQLGFLKMPYPQRRAQVPHDARLRFRSSTIGLLYGYALGMNYLTYVQTPILYIVTGAALLSADVTTAITIIAIFNIGRCLPVAVNFLPITNQSVQAWLAKWQERAVELDGFLLLSIGATALTMLTL